MEAGFWFQTKFEKLKLILALVEDHTLESRLGIDLKLKFKT